MVLFNHTIYFLCGNGMVEHVESLITMCQIMGLNPGRFKPITFKCMRIPNLFGISMLKPEKQWPRMGREFITCFYLQRHNKVLELTLYLKLNKSISRGKIVSFTHQTLRLQLHTHTFNAQPHIPSTNWTHRSSMSSQQMLSHHQWTTKRRESL